MILNGMSKMHSNAVVISEGWNVTTAVYLQNFDISAQDSAPRGLFFKPDGLKMYMTGDTNDKVSEYNLSTAWDVTTATYSQNFSIVSQDIFSTGVTFKPDGLKMYIVGLQNDKVSEYDLSTAWNVTTATYLQDFSVLTQDDNPRNVLFKPDGLKMYMLGLTNDKVSEYDLSTAWNVTTATYLQDFSVLAQDGQPVGLFFKPDGLKMYMVGAGNKKVSEYNLTS